MLWDEPKIFFLERRYFFSIILSEFLKNRVALQRRHHDGLRDIKKEGKGRAAELLHLTVRILTLPPIVIGVTLVMLYARGAERGSAAGRWSTESGERGCRLCIEGAPAPFEPN